ncbi:MAG: beta-N-acetylhexosaminidase, partial [Bacteriovoracaceae bacterium]|nr:beta-N-acetylhexosaminidase [Bacteriovoracaceae bacterium]
KKFLSKENIGGVILFAKNYEGPAQLAELVNSIQQCRDEYPLFIGIDHEGGRVIRFKKNFTQFPAMEKIAKLNSPKLVYEVHRVMAQELGACGINLSFSPVCDVLRPTTTKAIGDRAFSNDPIEVEKYVSAAIRGLQTNQIMSCAKHFPGHGNTSKDSHFDLPYITQGMDEFKNIDFIPFSKASRSKVDFMMMAHLVCDAIDKDLPCSLSPKAYDLLRKELKFKRCIISDDMNMEAITKNWGFEEAAAMAIEAGCNILCYRHFTDAQKGLEGIKEKYRSKSLDKTTLEERLSQITEMKKQNLKTYNPIYIPEITDKFKAANGKELLEDIQKQFTTRKIT